MEDNQDYREVMSKKSKLKARELMKNILCARESFELAVMVVRANSAPVWLAAPMAVLVGDKYRKLRVMMGMPAKVFRCDGRIDPRRYRRFVTKHKQGIFVKPTKRGLVVRRGRL